MKTKANISKKIYSTTFLLTFRLINLPASLKRLIKSK